MAGRPSELDRPAAPGPSIPRLLGLIRPYAGPLALASVIVIGISAVGLVAPRLAGLVLDSAFIDRDESQLNVILVALASLFAIRGLLRYIQIVLVHTAGARLLASLRGRLLDHLLTLSPTFFADRHTGELVSRLSSDIAKVQGALIDRVPDGVQATVTFIGTITMLFWLRTDLALLTLIVVPPVVVIAMFFGRSLMRLSRKTADATADATQVASEALGGLLTVQAFGREAHESEKHGGRLQSMVDIEISYARLLGSFSGLMQFVGFGAFAIVLWYGGRLVARDQMSPGD
ncbi:MAG: hypothetical protein KJO07_19605, partial [Deltaproteobacteria bacterium]|nr:hypothetical protein [Deltaproteobacteria bacterium]